ncbi:type II 3-dehydroquinate dehydratase [Aquirufa sp.]|jgi:3-dehydroquinate dehydratase-2|uniref:type II 3-dehydroquinate dehydratase n=1 Tax=Aquirufa sp. TaxID=2676249 RepID=UPI0037C0576C
MVRKKILILNGPNLNLLGTREPEIYGHQTFEQFLEILTEKFKETLDITYFQSNEEGALINKLHELGFSYDGIVFNAGGYTHTSIALGDAVAAIKTPVIEVHISNVHARESFRGHSYLSPNSKGIIVGFGLRGYELALTSFI